MSDPLAALPTAIAAVLEAAGWDGTRSTLALDVRTSAGTHLGRVEVCVLPHDVVMTGGQAYRVTPEAFLAALGGTVEAVVSKRQAVAAWAAGEPPADVGQH